MRTSLIHSRGQHLGHRQSRVKVGIQFDSSTQRSPTMHIYCFYFCWAHELERVQQYPRVFILQVPTYAKYCKILSYDCVSCLKKGKIVGGSGLHRQNYECSCAYATKCKTATSFHSSFIIIIINNIDVIKLVLQTNYHSTKQLLQTVLLHPKPTMNLLLIKSITVALVASVGAHAIDEVPTSNLRSASDRVRHTTTTFFVDTTVPTYYSCYHGHGLLILSLIFLQFSDSCSGDRY